MSEDGHSLSGNALAAAAVEIPAPEGSENGINVRDAARSVTEKRRELGGDTGTDVHTIPVDQDSIPEKGMTPRETADALSDYRKAQAKHQAALDSALGLTDGKAQSDNPSDPGARGPANSAADVPADEAGKQRAQEAERAKAAAEREAALYAQARAQHLDGLRMAHGALTQEFEREFPDVRSQADLAALASKDPDRFVRALAAANKVQAITTEHNAIKGHAAQQQQAQFETWAKEQDRSFADRHPELKDRAAQEQARNLVMRQTTAAGVSIEELSALWNGDATLSLRDHRVQDMLLDAARYREGKAAASKIQSAALPPVQRPGTRNGGTASATSSGVTAAAQAFAKKPNAENAAKLRAAQRATAR
jgi:hypothetical protein